MLLDKPKQFADFVVSSMQVSRATVCVVFLLEKLPVSILGDDFLEFFNWDDTFIVV